MRIQRKNLLWLWGSIACYLFSLILSRTTAGGRNNLRNEFSVLIAELFYAEFVDVTRHEIPWSIKMFKFQLRCPIRDVEALCFHLYYKLLITKDIKSFSSTFQQKYQIELFHSSPPWYINNDNRDDAMETFQFCAVDKSSRLSCTFADCILKRKFSVFFVSEVEKCFYSILLSFCSILDFMFDFFLCYANENWWRNSIDFSLAHCFVWRLRFISKFIGNIKLEARKVINIGDSLWMKII